MIYKYESYYIYHILKTKKIIITYERVIIINKIFNI